MTEHYCRTEHLDRRDLCECHPLNSVPPVWLIKEKCGQGQLTPAVANAQFLGSRALFL